MAAAGEENDDEAGGVTIPDQDRKAGAWCERTTVRSTGRMEERTVWK